MHDVLCIKERYVILKILHFRVKYNLTFRGDMCFLTCSALIKSPNGLFGFKFSAYFGRGEAFAVVVSLFTEQSSVPKSISRCSCDEFVELLVVVPFF